MKHIVSKFVRSIYLYLIIFSTGVVYAQSGTLNQFDFLMGNWDLHHSTNGGGTSTVQKVLDDKMLIMNAMFTNLPNGQTLLWKALIN